MKKKILFIIGSANQTLQMHQVAKHLATDYDCWFSHYFADSTPINWAIRKGWLDRTVLGRSFRSDAEAYCQKHELNIDYQAKKNQYDLVVTCSDMLVPRAVRSAKSVWVQEGMVDELTLLTKIVKALRLPRYWSLSTSLNGSSNLCDIFCAASEGYKSFFAGMGTDPRKIFVTGLANFDNLEQFRTNNFPYRDYVMVATSDIRETFRVDNRPAFIRKAIAIANGRRLLFKLHPNEERERAEDEIRQFAPTNTLVFQQGNTNEMIANCAELITQFSTVVYVGISLGKPVSSYFDVAELRRLTPIQNGGTSAENIAGICRSFINHNGLREDFVKLYRYEPVQHDKKPLSL